MKPSSRPLSQTTVHRMAPYGARWSGTRAVERASLTTAPPGELFLQGPGSGAPPSPLGFGGLGESLSLDASIRWHAVSPQNENDHYGLVFRPLDEDTQVKLERVIEALARF